MMQKEQEITESKGTLPEFLINPRYRIYRHSLLFIVVVAIALQLSSSEYLSGNKLHAIMQFGLFVGIVYLNICLLVPYFLFKNKLLSYIGLVFVSILLTIVLLIVFQYFSIVAVTENYKISSPLLSLLNAVSIIISLGLIIAGSTTILLFQRWIKYEQRIDTLKNATMKSELEQLKSQINPHFLFNMLNNANELTYANPDEAAKIIFKLTDLLKYQLNGSTKDEVLLSADIQFLTDFLNLEKIRRDNFEFIISTEGEINGIAVPPLLFIPFVENAAKHGNDNKSYIHLYFKVENGNLSFMGINSKPTEGKTKNSKSGGLGLANIKRRLELLYGQYYSLEIIENEITYTTKLQLKL